MREAVRQFADRLEEGLIALLLAAMTLLTLVQVVLRYVFNTGLGWSYEAATFLFAWLIFLGMSYGVKAGSHIGVDIFVKLFGDKAQRYLALAAVGCCLAYALLVLYGGSVYVNKMHLIGIDAEDIPFPRWVFLAVLPFGYALLTFRFAQVAWRIWTGRQTGLGLLDEANDAVNALKFKTTADETRNTQGLSGTGRQGQDTP